MTVSVDLRVLELICSRIVHDLVSPVGAVNNGVELIREMADENSPSRGLETEALALIEHSAEQGARRLRVLRLAYGAAGADAAWEELRSALSQFFTGSRIALIWPAGGAPDAIAKRGFGKMIVNAILLAADSLGQNGTVTVEARPNGAAVIATGTSPSLDAERSAALAGRVSPADLDARSIHAYLTGRFAAHYGVGFSMVSPATEKLEFGLTASA